MKQTINEYQFIEGFRAMRPDQFSVPALRALFAHLEELENDIGQDIEFDVIAICCDYSELTLEDINREHIEYTGDEPFDNLKDASAYMEEHTTVIPVEDSETIIIQNF